jgi:hypothetical protein
MYKARRRYRGASSGDGDLQCFPFLWNRRLGSAHGLASSSLSGGIVAVDQCRDVVAQYVIIVGMPRYLFACSCPFIFVLPGYFVFD